MTDVSLARRNLWCHFRSVTVLSSLDPQTGATLPHMDHLTRWLGEYQAAYLDAQREVNDGQFHGMTGRSLILTGDHLLLAFDDVRRLGAIAERSGMALVLSVSLAGVAQHRLAMATIRSAVPSVQFQIDCAPMAAPASQAAIADYRRALLDHVRSGGNLSLVGQLEDLRAAGLLESEEFNSNFFSLTTPHASLIRPVHRPHRFAPCKEFIAFYIAPQGDIYPCAGMLGHAPARFGSIEAPFVALADTLSATQPAIAHLASTGPRLAADETVSYPADLCALHRRSIEDLASL